MPALSERKAEIVRQLVEAAPDRVVGGLQAALAGTSDGDDSALGGVRRLVDAEVRDRWLRNGILQPIVPLCVGDGADVSRLTFPIRALVCLWRGLKTVAPEQVAEAETALLDYQRGENPNEPFDTLACRGAQALRGRETRELEQAAEACDAARPGGAALLAHCLELSPVVRDTIPKLPDWLTHFNEETTASARLAFKDAVAIAEDGGPWFFEMLAAQLPHPWMVLRIISAVMDKPTERYLFDSEMHVFGERVIRDIEAALKAVAELDLDVGPEAGRETGRRVELITALISEMETCVDLSRDHGWGHEIVKYKRNLASVVEAHLRNAEKLTSAVMPTQTVRLARIRHEVPKLDAMPDLVAVRRALTLLTFARDVRSSANYGGFAAARGKLFDRLNDMLGGYVEEVLDRVRAGEVEDVEVGYAFLEVAAEVTALVHDEKAAELVRRRATALRNEGLADAANTADA